MGFKVWKLVDQSKYLWHFEIYTGKRGKTQWEQGQHLGEHVVKTLAHTIPNQKYNLHTDNFFKSVPLALELLKEGFHLTGTIRGNRKIFKNLGLKTNLDLGEIDWKMQDLGILCLTWMDSSLVISLLLHFCFNFL